LAASLKQGKESKSYCFKVIASDVRACDGNFDSAIVLSKMLWRAY